jgi:chromosome transmission fidelity protein 4
MGDITALALSANGVYLATAAQSGVFIWSTQTRRVLIRLPPQPSAGSITQIAWSPTANILAWVDSNGTFIHHRDIVPKSFADPVKSSNSAAMIPRTKPRAATPLLFDDIPGADAPNDDLDVDMNPDDDGLHDFLDDDLGDFLKDDGGERQFRSGQVEVGKYSSVLASAYRRINQCVVNITKAQAAFQPGSTPMDAGKRKRLLGSVVLLLLSLDLVYKPVSAYNMIGYIEVTDQDTHHVVDVKMHDVSPESPRKGYHFTDNFKYNMAVLGM